MSEKMKKVTLDDLIKKAAEKNSGNKQTKKLHVQSLDGYIVIEKPDIQICMDVLDSDNEDEADKNMVYECVVEPSLKNKELQKTFGVARPLDIVEKIFEPGEIVSISREILKFAGYIDSVKPVEDVKN